MGEIDPRVDDIRLHSGGTVSVKFDERILQLAAISDTNCIVITLKLEEPIHHES